MRNLWTKDPLRALSWATVTAIAAFVAITMWQFADDPSLANTEYWNVPGLLIVCPFYNAYLFMGVVFNVFES